MFKRPKEEEIDLNISKELQDIIDREVKASEYLFKACTVDMYLPNEMLIQKPD